MKYCIGVDIGGTTVKNALFTEDGEIIEKWEIITHTENEGITILSDIANSVTEKLEKNKIVKDSIIGCGIGVPAPVSDEGVVNGSANLGWKYKEVKKEMEEALGIPVIVGNDASVAALGEMWKGGGMGYQNLVMVTLGTGVGGGIIYKGRILNGANGAGGEIGHLCVNFHEEDVCGCGHTGCLEQYSSATGVARLARVRLARNNEPSILRGQEITAKTVFDAVKEKDAVACKVAKDFGYYLGHALANVATVVDPEVFVIGGGVSRAGTVIIDYLQPYYIEKAFFANENVKFTLATLGNDAGVYGAAKLVLD